MSALQIGIVLGILGTCTACAIAFGVLIAWDSVQAQLQRHHRRHQW